MQANWRNIFFISTSLIIIAAASLYLFSPVTTAYFLHGADWRKIYQQCEGEDSAKLEAPQDLPSICTAMANAAVDRIQAGVSKLDEETYLPKGQIPRVAITSIENEPSQIDARVQLGPSGEPHFGQIVQSIAKGKDVLKIVEGCHNDPASADECQSLDWQGKKLLSDTYLSFAKVYPPSGAPLLLNVSSSSGGNCCRPSANVIDLTRSPPAVFALRDLGEDLGFVRLTPSRFVISGTLLNETDSNGDSLTGQYIYYQNRRLLISAPFDGRTDFSKWVESYPFQLLDDPGARAPLKKILGRNFKSFREHIAVASKGKLVFHRYLVGDGCVAHSCNDTGGLYIIDIATGKANAVWYDSEQGLKTAGAAPTDFSVKRMISDWIKSAGY